MILTDMLAWWYTTAWLQQAHGVHARVSGVLEAFSVALLTKTLFAPFRQIDAGGVRGSIDVQLRAWFDRTFSRFFGALIRSLMIFCGLLSAGVLAVLGALWLAFWFVVPILPIIGLVVAAA